MDSRNLDPAKRYQHLALLGHGAMGNVYRAYDCLLDREVALKRMHINNGAGSEEFERMMREARNSAVLSHQHIMTLYSAFTMDRWLVLVMELLEGGTLQDRMAGGMEILTAESYLRSLLSALSYAHRQGVVHRDIKPSNVMFTGHDVLRLCDFGLSKSEQDCSLTSTGTFLGTPHYMPCEQIMGEPAGPAADLYSVGVIAYEMFTGKKPFDGPSLVAVIQKVMNEPPRPMMELDARIPRSLNAVVLKALSKNPRDRFQTADEFLHALSHADQQLHSRVKSTAVAAGGRWRKFAFAR